jgi:putative endonuclease
MHYVYILYSPAINRFYIGEATDPDERLRHHRAGHQRYTRRTNDWLQVFLKAVDTRDEALSLERQIKRAKSRKTILRWIQGPDNQTSPAQWQQIAW